MASRLLVWVTKSMWQSTWNDKRGRFRGEDEFKIDYIERNE
jgi:hypothetical protein